jgi:hypothetical protein
LVLGVVAGCASGIRPEVLQSWVGRPAAALEREWGPPTREVTDGDLRILIYEEAERATSQNFSSPSGGGARGGTDKWAAAQAQANEAFRAPTVYARSYLFWVNREGAIVNATRRDP